MMPLRNKIPVRRLIPTRNPSGNNWREHKDDLSEDFNRHCGYCDSYDGFRHTYYEVDHFVPKSFFAPLGNIGLTQYSNLVYSCKFCNNGKRAKWPSKSETIYNDGKKGFVDPCSCEMEKHLYRTDDGGIMWKTELGKWMFSEAFKFDERQNSIKILWNLNRLRMIIDQLIVLADRYSKDSEEHNEIMKRLKDYTYEYYLYDKELKEYYK